MNVDDARSLLDIGVGQIFSHGFSSAQDDSPKEMEGLW